MAVSTDTLQTLLRQRQELREALLDLRKEIETLDASSLDLVNRNIKNQSAGKTPAPMPDPALDRKAEIPLEPSAAPIRSGQELPREEPDPPEVAVEVESGEKASPERAAAEVNNAELDEPNEPDKPSKAVEAIEADKTGDGHGDLDSLIEKARGLSDYLLDHPSELSPAELGALDTAITKGAAATTPAEKDASYHTLQAAYRKISAESFATTGVNGTTLRDSAAGAPLLWTVPLSIIILTVIVFPLLLLARHLTGQMFTEEFAADLTWSIGVTAAFLWGVVGALTLLTLNIALAVRRRHFDGGVRTSPGLRGSLGGLIGAAFFMTLEIWVPMKDATAEFALNMTAFAGGILSAILFAGVQRGVSIVVAVFEPKSPKPTVSPASKK
ncbi:hypothetical protein [Sneathiella litorea]|uniref:Uncharacterized protein n=1 Tax=Sneathiella litorea TaxID=2606216 RepID=A0A6L8W8G1_9PROT|nr:hypothetical protein [Sneathiella litorea]MZR30959.1 hypothetical protein [Sneathiella litorea]